jgi:hypothetical protein
MASLTNTLSVALLSIMLAIATVFAKSDNNSTESVESETANVYYVSSDSLVNKTLESNKQLFSDYKVLAADFSSFIAKEAPEHLKTNKYFIGKLTKLNSGWIRSNKKLLNKYLAVSHSSQAEQFRLWEMIFALRADSADIRRKIYLRELDIKDSMDRVWEGKLSQRNYEHNMEVYNIRNYYNSELSNKEDSIDGLKDDLFSSHLNIISKNHVIDSLVLDSKHFHDTLRQFENEVEYLTFNGPSRLLLVLGLFPNSESLEVLEDRSIGNNLLIGAYYHFGYFKVSDATLKFFGNYSIVTNADVQTVGGGISIDTPFIFEFDARLSMGAGQSWNFSEEKASISNGFHIDANVFLHSGFQDSGFLTGIKYYPDASLASCYLGIGVLL